MYESRKRRITKIDEHVDALKILLLAEKNESTYSEDVVNWQADKAREVCIELLAVSKTLTLNGCRLCRR